MKTLQTIVIALVAVLVLTAAAEATVDLWTSPLFVAANDNIECTAFNTSQRAVTFELTLYSDSGGVQFGPTSFPVPPRTFFTASFSFFKGDYYTCRFTVLSKTALRANATGRSGVGTDTVAVPAQ